MKPKLTTVLSRLVLFATLFFFLPRFTAYGQTVVFADVVSDQDETDLASLAIDGDLSTKATVRASSGLAAGIGAYSGYLELLFPAMVPANTTTYIKIDADDNLFPALLGGSLGGLLSDVLGVVLIGNQEFTVQALNGGTEIIRGDSQIDNDFASDRLRLVINANNEYFIAITPDQTYDRIRVRNRLGSLLGLFNTRELGVYGAYYVETPNNCGEAAFTSYDGSGLNLDALNIGGVGVSNPNYVLDNDPNNYSRLSMGILSVAGSIEQTVYFEGPSNATDNFNVRLKVDPSLLTLGVANNISIMAHNGGALVQNISLSSLLNADLLTLLQGNQAATIPFSPGAAVTRITVRYSALLNVNLTQSLDLYDIIRTPALPIIDVASQNKSVCIGETTDLVATATPSNLEVRWYDDIIDGNLLATTASGDPFTTPAIQADITFYVATAKPGCTEESARVAVSVSALALPTANDISVTGNENVLCESSSAVLLPSSAILGTFNWYLNSDKTNPITDGQVINGATYTIDSDGILTIVGLTEANSPYDYFVGLVNADSGCENAAGDLKQVTVSVVDNNLAPTISLDANITADDTINASEASGPVNITGTVGGDAQVGDTVRLIVNEVVYTGTVAPDFSFSIPVNGADLVADSNHIIDGYVDTDNGVCTSVGSQTEGYLVDIIPPTAPTVNAQTTNNTTPIITGTADSVDSLTVMVNGVTYTEGDGNLVDNGDNTWSLSIPVANALTDGIYDVAATTTDLAGNSTNDITVDELVIDTIPPTVPTVSALITANPTPTISGTADSIDNLVVEVNGIVYTEGDGNLVDHGNNTWSLSIPAGDSLPDGTYDVGVTATDTAGNSANDITTDELIINSLAPVNPTVDPLSTNDTTPVITGTANSVDDLVVEVNGVLYTEGDGNLVDNGDNTWSLTIPDPNALADGIYDVKAIVTNIMGHTANDSTVNELEIDTIPPTNPTVDPQNTNDTTPDITGTADSTDDLTVEVNGVVYTEGDGNLVDNGDNTWSLTVPAANALPEGIYDVVATATDLAGNTSNDSTVDELTIDTTAPTNPTVVPQTTNDTTPTVTGTADSTDDLTVEVNGIVYTEGDGNLVDNGDNTWGLTIPDTDALPEGVYEVVATATDLAGNTSNDTTFYELSIDTTAPTNPTVDPQTTNDTTPTVTGTADSTDDLTVEVNGVVYTEGDGNLIDNGDNTWSLTVPDVNALPEGVYDVEVTATDAAGNTSNDTTVNELEIDTTAPVNPTVDPQNTNDTTPDITGTADSTDNLTVEVNGVVYTEGDGNLVDNGDNTWSLTVPDANALPEGVYDVVVTATDVVGNTSNDTTVNELAIDTTTPTNPTVDTQDTNNTTPTITGTADSTDDLTVAVDGVVYTEGDGNLVDNGDNTWSLTVPEANALPVGIYDVVVTAMDAAGNTANDTTVDELEIMELVSDLTITKTVDRTKPLVGENVIFTVEVKNNGQTNFIDIVVREQLRSGFTYVKSTASNGQYNSVTGIWNISDLSANAVATLTLEAKVGAIGDLTNTAIIESSSPQDLDGDNNTAEVVVELNCLVVFNEFTPNNDGANDSFRIECIEKYPSSTLHIYNRNGNLVYRAQGYKNDWEGYANVSGVVNKGEQLPQGNYYYLLKIDELGKDKTGWIYLGK